MCLIGVHTIILKNHRFSRGSICAAAVVFAAGVFFVPAVSFAFPPPTRWASGDRVSQNDLVRAEDVSELQLETNDAYFDCGLPAYDWAGWVQPEGGGMIRSDQQINLIRNAIQALYTAKGLGVIPGTSPQPGDSISMRDINSLRQALESIPPAVCGGGGGTSYTCHQFGQVADVFGGCVGPGCNVDTQTIIAPDCNTALTMMSPPGYICPVDRTVCCSGLDVCSTGSGCTPEYNASSCIGALPVCGDGFIGAGEQCDDGNTVPGDGCSAACQNEAAGICGNGIIEPPESCEPPNLSTCDSGCQTIPGVGACPAGTSPIENTCFVDDSGAMDEANTTASCITYAGTFVPPSYSLRQCAAFPTECRVISGNKLQCCYNICTLSVCGNGFVEFGELCDDGNVVNGDGCSSSCVVEAPAFCGDGSCNGPETCDSCATDCTNECCAIGCAAQGFGPGRGCVAVGDCDPVQNGDDPISGYCGGGYVCCCE